MVTDVGLNDKYNISNKGYIEQWFLGWVQGMSEQKKQISCKMIGELWSDLVVLI